MTNKEFMTTKEVADTLGIKKNTLALWRMKGFGPKYYKLGRSVRYKKADVEDWIDENISQSTAKTKK